MKWGEKHTGASLEGPADAAAQTAWPGQSANEEGIATHSHLPGPSGPRQCLSKTSHVSAHGVTALGR